MPAKLQRGRGYVFYNPFGSCMNVLLAPDVQYVKSSPVAIIGASPTIKNAALKVKANVAFNKVKTATARSEPLVRKRKKINTLMVYNQG
tara:strand:- start:2119 stop:2385 length:267 start_codon:yes stop_codon:yes gene_type:complete